MFSRCFIQCATRKRIIASPRFLNFNSIRRATIAPTTLQHLPRSYTSKSIADEKIEEIQELYATARDEFEIAAEETEKMSIYAQDDRDAARQELEKLKSAFKAAIEGENKEIGEEIRTRIGQRIRELDNAVVAMEEMAQNQD